MKQLMNMSDIVLDVLKNHIGETILFTHDAGKFTIKLDNVQIHKEYPTILLLSSDDDIFMVDSRVIMYDSLRIQTDNEVRGLSDVEERNIDLSKKLTEKEEYIEELTNKLSRVYSQEINLDFESDLVGKDVCNNKNGNYYIVLAELKTKNHVHLLCERSGKIYVYVKDKLVLS